MIPPDTVKDWVKNKKRIQDRLNRIKKRLKKLQKQEKHFEMRLRVIAQNESKATRPTETTLPEPVRGDP
jgi:chaperonin cofactor prefoldin